MTDWTTCRVVRDRDGDLWFRGCDSDDLWTANTNCPDIFLTTDEVLTVFGPLTPVLDADGLPVVTTVGDLTARHLGKRVQVEGCAEGHVYKMVSSGMSPVYPRIRLAIENDDDCWWLPAFLLDTPCEVLP